MSGQQASGPAALRSALEDTMREFARLRANLVAARRHFNRRLMQGGIALVVTAVLMGLGFWPLVWLALALVGGYWLLLAYELGAICDHYQEATQQARKQLRELLEQPDAGPLYQELYREMSDFKHRHWLREYLPPEPEGR